MYYFKYEWIEVDLVCLSLILMTELIKYALVKLISLILNLKVNII